MFIRKQKERRSETVTRNDIKNSKRGKSMLKALHEGGLFRWERMPSKSESAMNVLTHGIGMGLSLAGIGLLCGFAAVYGNAWSLVTSAIFGMTMFMLYFGSTMCHAMLGQKYESFFEVWDSVAIYALIAGTYTPFLLVNMRGRIGWTTFGILWGIAVIGAVMKIARPNYQPKWIVILYLLMGWALLFILPPMLRTVPETALWFILAGGLSYSVGVLFYIWRRLPFSHAIWHTFVIGGTVCMFFAVLYGTILEYK